MKFARYIKRQEMKRKYGTNQISAMWKEYQFARCGGIISEHAKEKLTAKEQLETMSIFFKKHIQKNALKR